MKFQQSSPMKRKRIEEQWIRDLQIFKRQTTSEKKGVQRVLDDNEVTTEMVDKELDHVATILKEIEHLKQSLDYVCHQYQWLLENDDRQIDERDKTLTKQERVDAAVRRN